MWSANNSHTTSVRPSTSGLTLKKEIYTELLRTRQTLVAAVIALLILHGLAGSLIAQDRSPIEGASQTLNAGTEILPIFGAKPLFGPKPPTIVTRSLLPGATVGTPYPQQLNALGATPMSWTVTSGSLPSGLNLSISTGIITGTPTFAGVFTSTVTATNSHGSDSKPFSITVSAVPPIIGTAILPAATAGVAYSQTLEASGTAPITWSVTTGALPAGLTLGPASGIISGTPTVTGVYTLTLVAANSAGSNSKQLSLTVNAVAPSISVAPTLPAATIGASYSQTLTANGTAPITWSVSGSALPPGLVLGSSTGIISGTPTATGVFTPTVIATNSGGSDSRQLTLNVNGVPPAIATVALAAATAGTAYSQTLTASGTSPLAWSISGGALPAGLALAPSAGIISGTPTVAGTFTLTVTATNSAGSDSRQLSLTVNAVPPIITTAQALPDAIIGTAYSLPLTASGTAPLTWTVASGALPAGLSLGGTTGIISGTPTMTGVFTPVVTVANTAGSNSQQLSLKVNALPPSILTGSTLPPATAGTAYSQTLAATGTAPITWSLTNGTLPSGLTLGASSGLISGTPGVAGVFTPTITAANAGGTSSKQFSLAVAAAPLPPIGINISEAEYSWGSFAGASDLLYIRSNNISIARLPISWERAQPTLNGPLDPTYINALKAFILSAGAQGLQLIVDVHNYGRYDRQWAQTVASGGNVAPGQGDLIGSSIVPISAFADLWTKLAGALKGTPGLAYYDIMNEPYNMGSVTVWPSAAQAAVNAIRSVDMATAVMVEGTQWASARWWPSDNGNLHITDPANNLLYEAHLYFDANGSGTYTQTYTQQGAYPTIGVDYLQPFLTWLKQNGARGFLGEFGIPNNDPLWLPVLDNFMTALQSAGLSGTYWNYAFHSPTDPPWWPASDPMSIIIGLLNPQMGVILAHNSPH